MNRVEASQITSLLPAISDMFNGNEQAQTRLMEVAPVVRAFSEGQPIRVGSEVITALHADVAFDTPDPLFYGLVPATVPVQIDNLPCTLNLRVAIAAGLVQLGMR